MRPKGLIIFLVVVVALVVFFYFFSDNLIESQLEDIGSDIVGAKVEIDNLNFSIAGLSLSMDSVQVANPNDTWKNLFQTGRLAFDMEVLPLSYKKIMINEIAVTGVRLGAKRSTDGKVEKTAEDSEPGWFSEASASLKKQVAAAPVLNLGMLKKKVNVDSLIAMFDIQALTQISSARNDAQTTFKNWDNTFANFNPKADLEKVGKEINALKSQELSGVPEMLLAVDKTKNIITDLNGIKTELEATKKTLTSDFERVTQNFKSIDNWIADDFNNIKSKANIAEFNTKNVGKMLFGDVVVQPTLGTLKYVDMARKYMPVAEQFLAAGKVEKPPRFQGQDILFPILNQMPQFLIENIAISAGNNQAADKAFIVNGEVHGIASEPKVYGKPLTFALSADLPGSNAYAVAGEFDHTNEPARDRIEIKAAGVHLGKLALPQKKYLPNAINAETGNIQAAIGVVGDELDIKIGFSASPVSFAFGEGSLNNDIISSVTSSVFHSIDELTLSVGIRGKASDLSLGISSNIDAILASRIKNVIGESAQAVRSEIERKLNDMILPKKQEALAFVNNNKARITNELDKVNQQLNGHLQFVEEKKQELENKIKEKSGPGVGDVLKKIKNPFKKK